jgi:hypothetical protein
VKFQIGANSGFFAVGVMILALACRSLNPAYTSMPEYASALQVTDALQPKYLLLIMGIRGDHESKLAFAAEKGATYLL